MHWYFVICSDILHLEIVHVRSHPAAVDTRYTAGCSTRVDCMWCGEHKLVIIENGGKNWRAISREQYVIKSKQNLYFSQRQFA
jgi:hypothetical protein